MLTEISKIDFPRLPLTAEDINHYGKITVALREPIRLLAEIDELIEKHGGFPLAGSQN